MQLTSMGANLAMKSAQQRIPVATQLLNPVAPLPITNFVPGNCYEVIAFTRYLLGANITPDQLATLNGQAWAPLFMNAPGGVQWHGGPIAAGTAVIFSYPNGNPFHAAIAVGAFGATTILRSTNQPLLGGYWNQATDCNIDIVNGIMNPVPENQATIFQFSANAGDRCTVFVSGL